MSFYCDCRCGCDAEVFRNFIVCIDCKKGKHKTHFNLDLTTTRECDSCELRQVFDRVAKKFTCHPECGNFSFKH